MFCQTLTLTCCRGDIVKISQNSPNYFISIAKCFNYICHGSTPPPFTKGRLTSSNLAIKVATKYFSGKGRVGLKRGGGVDMKFLQKRQKYLQCFQEFLNSQN